MKRAVIYCHTNKENGKKYVGQTSQPGKTPREMMHARWRQHKAYALRGATHCRVFYNAIRKYGHAAFAHRVLAVVTGARAANAAEARWIKFLNSVAPRGYNLEGGGGVSKRVHPETRLKMAAWTKDPIKRQQVSDKISAAWTPERRKAQAALTSKINKKTKKARVLALRRRHAQLTPAQRLAYHKKCRATQVANTTHAQRSAAAKKAIAGQSATQLSARVAKGWAKLSADQREKRLSKTHAARIATLKAYWVQHRKARQ